MSDEDCNVLIVDDLEANALALVALLRRPGLRLLTAKSGTEALELLLTTEIAVAVLDVQMPGMDGFELAELMRGTDRTRDTPIIFVTAGGSDVQRILRGYESGAVDYLVKPLDPVVIGSKVEVFVQMHRQRRELSRRLAELGEALRINQMFTAILGHDLRSPLSSIMHGAEFICCATEQPAAIGAAQRILRSGARMSRLIDQMLDTARIRSGQFTVELKPVSLQRVVDDIRSEFDAEGTGRAVEVEAVGNVSGTWDDDRLGQLMSNLVGNAVKHGAPDAPVRVVIDGSDPQRVALEVSNGGAICPSVLPYLFDPFRVGLPADRSSNPGLGLGLYISHEIVRAHRGEIRVLSNAADGTVFMVSLPRNPADAREPSVLSSMQSTHSRRAAPAGLNTPRVTQAHSAA
jgi:two-component system, sensor histidine kinase and response regulator